MIVVTGPTGNVGAEITQMLVTRQPQVPYRIAAHNPEKIYTRYGRDVPVAKLNYDDRSSYGPVLQGITKLFLLFPLPHPKTVQTRMKPFIDAAVAAGVQHIVYVTVPGADTFKVVPHYHVERHIESTGVNHTFLRASYFMQNLCRQISTHGVDIARHREIFIPAGQGRTSFIDSRDVASVALDVFDNPEKHVNQSYVLTGAERLTFNEVARQFTEVLGKPIRYTSPSFLRFWHRVWRRGVAWDVVLFMTIVYTLTRTGQNEPLTDEVRQLLGRPPTSVRQFIQDYRTRWETQSWT